MKSTAITLLLMFIFSCISNQTCATIFRVPQDYNSIMQAVEQISENDTVLISTGIYNEQISIRGRSFVMAGVFLFTQDSNDIANTIIRLPDSLRTIITDNRSVIRLDNCGAVSIIGLTIRDGLGCLFSYDSTVYNIYGGNLLSDSTNLFLHNVIIKNGIANVGGGIGNYMGSTTLMDSRIDSCVGYGISFTGGGTYFFTDSLDTNRMIRNVITNCSHEWLGGGLYSIAGCNILSENLITNNTSVYAAGVLIGGYVFIQANNNVFANNMTNKAVCWLINLNRNRNLVNQFFENTFQQNTTYQNGSSNPGACGVYFQNTDSTNWNVYRNNFIDNINLTLVNGYCVEIQRGIVNMKYNIFYNNISFTKSVMAIRQSATVFFDSNIVMSNGVDRLILLLSNSRIFTSNNDFLENSGAIFEIDPTSSHGYLFNNYWGHPSGPRAIGNPNGQGDSIGYWYNNNYEYIPFRTTPVYPELPVKEFGGDGNPNDRGQNGSGLPNTITIENVYPNPTNSTLTVHYTLSRPQLISIRLYDTNGREVYASLPQPQIAGSHSFSLQTDGITSGLYFLKLSSPTSPTETALQKVVLLK